MSSGLAASHQTDGARQQRRLNSNDFRVGSYVVHSPPAAEQQRSHIPGYQFARSRFAFSAGCQSRPQLPRAIPRSVVVGEMGDRLSVASKPAQRKSSDLAESSPLSRYVRQSERQPPVQVTPRLPRGVSRIPHQVQQPDNAAQDHSREPRSLESNRDETDNDSSVCSQTNNNSKYLTFNKDQATSHFKSLREELGKASVNSSLCQANSSNHRPSPVERQRTRVAQRAAELELSAQQQDSSQKSAQAKPICEAFIMTGQSMLKLSCSESENSGRQTRKRSHQSGERLDSLKSASLDQLDSAPRATPHLSAEHILTSQVEAAAEKPPLGQMSPERAQLEHSHSAEETHRGRVAVDGRNSADGDAHQTAPISDETPSTTTTTTIEAEQQKPTEVSSQANEQTPAPSSRNQSPVAGEQLVVDEEQVKLVSLEATRGAVDGGVVKAECDTTTQLDNNNEEPTKSTEQQDETGDTSINSTASATDRDSARRLAKRLYNLSGFKRSDVCHHLAKNNPFSKLVADEYLSLFDFRSMKLDAALRKFLSKLQLNGETQERERMLGVFSQRYFDCNRDKFPSAEVVQTLVCAMILLNTDLHGAKKGRSKLGLGAFVDGLNSSLARPSVSVSSSALNNSQQGYIFPRHLLVDLYESIRKRPLKCSDDKCDMSSFEAELDKIYSQQVGANRSNTLPTRRFAPGSNAPSSTLSANARRHLKQGLDRLNGQQQDDQEAAIEFKSGPLNRKRVFEAGGQPTGRGRRSWRRVQTILLDLRLILRPFSAKSTSDNIDGSSKLTAKQAAKQRALLVAQDMKNTVKLHHTFAKRSSSYTKRDYVFHLRLADQSEFLMQASSEQELTSWIDTINFASACLSSPALPSAVSSAFKHRRRYGSNKRPILPASYTKLSYWEQLIDHEERLQRLKQELDEHLSEAPKTKNATKRDKTEFIEKIAYLKQEIERYTVYVDLMRKKSNSPEAIILSKHPQIASLTPSEEMILTLPSAPHLVESKESGSKLSS